MTLTPVGERCPDCGAEILRACPNCKVRIRGRYHVQNVIGPSDYEPPRFCDKCGAPFPWLDREGRIYELQNLLDQQDLDPADELTVREQLEALANPDLSQEEQAMRWKRVKQLAPGLLESGRSLVESLAHAYIKKELGL